MLASACPARRGGADAPTARGRAGLGLPALPAQGQVGRARGGQDQYKPTLLFRQRELVFGRLLRRMLVILLTPTISSASRCDAPGRAICAGKVKATLDDVKGRALAAPGDAASGVLTARGRMRACAWSGVKE